MKIGQPKVSGKKSKGSGLFVTRNVQLSIVCEANRYKGGF